MCLHLRTTRQEYENLLRLVKRGLSILLAICTAEVPAEFARLKPEIVFLAPSIELWAKGRMRSKELLRRCAALAGAAQGTNPIVLMAAAGAVSLVEARKSGASALLIA